MTIKHKVTCDNTESLHNDQRLFILRKEIYIDVYAYLFIGLSMKKLIS